MQPCKTGTEAIFCTVLNGDGDEFPSRNSTAKLGTEVNFCTVINGDGDEFLSRNSTAKLGTEVNLQRVFRAVSDALHAQDAFGAVESLPTVVGHINFHRANFVAFSAINAF